MIDRHKNPDSYARAMLEEFMEADKRYKEQLCENGPEDVPDRILWMTPDDSKGSLIMPMVISAGPSTPAEMIGATAMMARKEIGTPWLVCFLAEVYVQLDIKDAADVPTERGQLTERFQRGDPHVREAISAILVHRRLDGSFRTLACNIPYRYGDGGVIWEESAWVDSLKDDNTSMGAIPDALITAFGGSHN